MTLMDIVKEYDKIVSERKGELPHYELDNQEYYYFNDMRKKLNTVSFYLGLPDLKFLKGEDWRNYCFDESEKEYIFHLFELETTKLFRNLKKGKKREIYLKEEDYKEYIKEIEKLREYIKNRVKDETKFIEIIQGVYSKTRYPQLKYYYDELRPFEENCLRSFVSEVEYPSIAYWDELYVDEQLFLIKKLRNLIKEWEEIVCDIAEKRHDEIMDGIEKIPELQTYSLGNIFYIENKLQLEKEREKGEILERALEKRKCLQEDFTEKETEVLEEYDKLKAISKSAFEKLKKSGEENVIDILEKEYEEILEKADGRNAKRMFQKAMEIEEIMKRNALCEKECICKERGLSFEKYLEEEKELEQYTPQLTSAIRLYEEAVE